MTHRHAGLMRRHLVIVGAIAAQLMLIAPTGVAAADPAQVTLDSEKVTLAKESAGGWSATVGLTNVTDGPVAVVARSAKPGCALTVNDGSSFGLPAAKHTDVTVGIPAACDAGADAQGFAFTVGPDPPKLAATAKASSTEVDWTPLVAFLVAVAAALLVVGVVLGVWWGQADDDNKTHVREKTKSHAKHGLGRALQSFWFFLFTPLDGLNDSWSFKDSWVTNVTAGSGLVITVLGSADVLKAVLGDTAEETLGVITVAAAIALALTGAAGVIVLTVKRPASEFVTVSGLLVASAIAFGAAAGQVWAIALLLGRLDLGSIGDVAVWVAVGLATVLLIAYAFTSLIGLLTEGTIPPQQWPLSAVVPTEVYSAAIVAAALDGDEAVNSAHVESLLRELTPPKEQPETDAVLPADRAARLVSLRAPRSRNERRSAMP